MADTKNKKPKILSRLFFIDVFSDRRTWPFFTYAILIILIGTAIYHWLERWDWLDSFYFVMITLTTIGYGDFSPTTPLTKIITVFYGMNGIIVLLMLYDIIRKKRHLEIPDEESNSVKG
jgi:hypothetical protein